MKNYKSINLIPFSKCFLVAIMIAGCDINPNKGELTMDSSEIVHALVQIATVKGILEVSDVSAHDSLFSHYKNEIERLTNKDYDEIIRNLNLLEKMPDSLSAMQTRALDTLRQLQNKLIYEAN